jgi:hypothetical protein
LRFIFGGGSAAASRDAVEGDAGASARCCLFFFLAISLTSKVLAVDRILRSLVVQ